MGKMKDIATKREEKERLTTAAPKVWHLFKYREPFEQQIRWLISADNSSPFGRYDTVKEAKADARLFGINLCRRADMDVIPTKW